MELPFERKTPTLADLKEKGVSFRTKYYELTNADDLNNFVQAMQDVANNPLKYSVLSFSYESQIDGAPFVVVRFKDDAKVNEATDKKYDIFAKIFTVYEFPDLDAIINAHDKTKVCLLAEKSIQMKTGDYFIMLIWAKIEKPRKSMEGLDVLRHIFVNKIR